MKILFFVVLFLFGNAHAEEMYAWDWINDEGFSSSYANIQTGFNLPEWAVRFNGVSTPSYKTDIEGITYTVIQICKRHDCGNKNITVLYAPQGSSFALFNGVSTYFMGKPSGIVQKKLLELHQSSYTGSKVKERLSKSN